MKKSITLLILMLIISSTCFAYDIFSIQRGNWHLTMDEISLFFIFIFMLLLLPIIYLLIFALINIPKAFIEFITTYKLPPMDILKRRLSQGKITYEDLKIMKKEIEESNPSLSKNLDIKNIKRRFLAIPEKCSHKT